MYDLIVIGARCAGASTAMLMARKGYRVLLVDRDKFPKEIRHGHFIYRRGPDRLRRWGLLDRIVSANCPPIDSFLVDLGDFPLVGRDLVMDGVALGYAPRRAGLDQVLAEAAVEAGAELRPGVVVQDILTDGERVTGIRGRDVVTGQTLTEHAQLIVGADGRHSLVARAAGAAEYYSHPAVTCWYFSYWSGLASNRIEAYHRSRNAIFAFPTNDGLTGIFVGWPNAEFKTIRADIERNFMTALDQAPDLAARVRSGRREEPFYGTADVPNFLRKPFGPGWALVGDAGCHKDPYLALGICDAFRDADWLCEAIDKGMSGQSPPTAALAEFEHRRNAATLADYKQNLELAQFKPIPAEVLRLRQALRGNQAETNRFFLARYEMIPPETFFNPANLARLMGQAQGQFTEASA